MSALGAGSEVPTWKYVNATMLELGHALFGSDNVGTPLHDRDGNATYPFSIMDYSRAYKQGAGFVPQQ